VALPDNERRGAWRPAWFATRSGYLLAVLTFDPAYRPRHAPRPALLVRSTDRAWTSLERVGSLPQPGKVSVTTNTITVCDATQCSFSKDLGDSWQSYRLPD